MGNPPVHYLDTNVLIAIIDGRDQLTSSQFNFLRRLETGEALAATSEITLAECLIKPYELSRDISSSSRTVQNSQSFPSRETFSSARQCTAH